MNKEFDPRLTGRGLNSYAEGMAEGNGEIDTGAKEAASNENVEKAVKKLDQSAEKLNQSTENLRDIVESIGRNLAQQGQIDLRDGMQRGTIGQDQGEDLQNKYYESHNVPVTPTFEVEKKTLFRNDVDEYSQREAFRTLQMAARQLKAHGTNNIDIDALANADPNNISISDMRNLVNNAEEDRKDKPGIFREIKRVQDGISEGQRVSYGSQEYNEQMLKQYYPPSLEDVGERIMDLEDPKYQRGGEYEIVDENGNLKVWNMRRWMREKWLRTGHQLDPDNPKSAAWNTVSIQSLYTRLDLMTLLTNNMFFRKRVAVRDENNNQRFKNGEPEWAYEDSPEYQNFKNELLNEFWLYSKAHEFDASSRPFRGNEKQYFEQIAQLYGQNVWLKGRDRIMVAWKLDATSGDEEQLRREYAEWMNKRGSGGPEKEGRGGRAHRMADALYFRIAQLEKFDKWNRDKKSGYEARMKQNYDYSDNKFHELLGEKGVKEFYSSMVRRGLSSLCRNDEKLNLKTEIKLNEKDKREYDFFGVTEGLKGFDFMSLMTTSDKSKFEKLLAPDSSGGNALRDALKRDIFDDVFKRKIRKNDIKKEIDKLSISDLKKFDDALDARVNLLRSNLPDQAVKIQSEILKKLTGYDDAGRKIDSTGVVGLMDNSGKRVRDLFISIRDLESTGSKKSEAMVALEELGLRFISQKLGKEKSKASEWDKNNEEDRDTAWKATRKELNLFNAQSKPDLLNKAVRQAIQDAIGKENGLDEFDAEYMENFAFAKVYFTFTSGYNDTTATGFDAATKLMRFMDYRKNNTFGRKNFVGNQQNIPGVKRLLLTLWEGAYGTIENPKDGSLTKASLLSVMENGFTDKTRSEGLQTIDFDSNKEATFGSNHVASAFAFYTTILKGPVFDFAKSVTVDAYNNVQTKPEAMAQALNEINKNIRYTYNQLGLNFEDMEDEIELVWEPDEDGKMVASPVFKKEKLKDALWAKEVVNMGMYEQREFASLWANKKVGMKDINGEDMISEYSRNIMAYFIAKEILEHRLRNPKDASYNYNIWELGMIQAIEGFFANIPGGELEERAIGLFNRNKKMRKTGSFFNAKEFKKIRLMGNAGYGKLWFEALRAQVAESAWKGNTGTGNKFFAYIFQDMWSFK
ncbi:MAG TPA: hypothetical protein VF189_04775 [Patescibacteria group bacterium]